MVCLFLFFCFIGIAYCPIEAYPAMGHTSSTTIGITRAAREKYTPRVRWVQSSSSGCRSFQRIIPRNDSGNTTDTWRSVAIPPNQQRKKYTNKTTSITVSIDMIQTSKHSTTALGYAKSSVITY